MKKTKVENISKIKLEFFLKQNKEDVRVVLNPGEFTWCNHGTTTKSMVLYERKGLIKSTSEDIIEVEVVKAVHKVSKVEPEVLPAISDIEYLQDRLLKSLALTPIQKAEKETEEYKKESEKTYKGKKRGRKKKRGPKPGSKRKKSIDKPSTDSPSQ